MVLSYYGITPPRPFTAANLDGFTELMVDDTKMADFSKLLIDSEAQRMTRMLTCLRLLAFPHEHAALMNLLRTYFNIPNQYWDATTYMQPLLNDMGAMGAGVGAMGLPSVRTVKATITVCNVALTFNPQLKVGIGLAGNCGRLWGDCGNEFNGGPYGSLISHEQMSHTYRTQEESVVCNMYHADKDRFSQSDVLHNRLWGLKKLHLTASEKAQCADRTKDPIYPTEFTQTYQGVDYTNNVLSAKSKYGHACAFDAFTICQQTQSILPVTTTLQPCRHGTACYRTNPQHKLKYSHPCKHGPTCKNRTPVHWEQETHHHHRNPPKVNHYNTAAHRQVVVVVSGGPNNGCTGSPAGAMARTNDPRASDWDYFQQGVIAAFEAILREMHNKGVNVALLPLISGGLYAGLHKRKLNTSQYVDWINTALQNLQQNVPLVFHEVILVTI